MALPAWSNPNPIQGVTIVDAFIKMAPQPSPQITEKDNPKPDKKPAKQKKNKKPVPKPQKTSPDSQSSQPEKPAEIQYVLNDLVSLSLVNDPEMNVLRSRVEANYYDIDIAKANWRPQVVLEGSAGKERNNPGQTASGLNSDAVTTTATTTSLSLRQRLFDGFETDSQVGSAEHRYRAGLYEQAANAEDIVLDTISNFSEVVKWHNTTQYAKENIAYMGKIKSIASAQLSAGEATKGEVFYVNGRLRFAETQLVRSTSSYKDAFIALQRRTGPLKEGIFSEKNPITDPKTRSHEIMDETIILNKARQHNNDFLQILAQIEERGANIGTAKSAYYPTVEGVIEGNNRDDVGGEVGNEQFASAGLDLRYTLYDGGRREKSLKQAQAQRDEVSYQKVALLKDLKDQTQSILNQLNAIKTNQNVRREELADNISLLKINEDQFHDGDTHISNLVETQERILDSQTALEELNAQELVLRARLMKVQGTLLDLFHIPDDLQCATRGTLCQIEHTAYHDTPEQQ
jgi:adhesin transport system outer membrane protein